MHHEKAVNRKFDLTTGPFLGKIIRYAVPIMITNMIQLLFNAADLVVVGQVRGSQCVGAVGATSSLINLIVNTFIGLSVGVGVAAAQGLGAKDDEGVQRAVHTSVPFAVAVGAVVTFVGIFWSEEFLVWMDPPADLLPLSTLYFRIYCGSAIPILLYNFGAAILRAAGDTKTPFFILFSAGVLNIGMNFLFVLAFGMDVDGVAFATLLSQAFSAAAVVFALCRRTDACRLELKKMRFYKEELKKILRIGAPSSVQGSLFYISQVVIQSSVNSFGSVTVQGSAAAVSILGFVNAAVVSFYHAAMNFTGQNYGARKFGNIRKVLWCSLGCTTVAGLIIGVASWIFAHPLLSLYLRSDAAAEAFEAGVIRLLCVGAPYCFCGIMDVMSGMLRGLGCSVPPMVICAVGTCGVRFFFSLVLFRMEAFHNLYALLLSFPASWILTAAAEFTCFLIVWKREKRRAEAEAPAEA